MRNNSGQNQNGDKMPIQVKFTNSKRSLLTLEWNSPKDGKPNKIDFSMVPSKSLLTIRDYH